MSPTAVIREVVEAAIEWRRTKTRYLAAADRRSLPESEVASVRRVHLKAVERLDKAVHNFERLQLQLKAGGGRKKPINWKKMIDGLAMVATTLSKATDVQTPAPVVIRGEVIDMPVDGK